MRAGWVVSFIGHVGFVIMTMLAWEVNSRLPTEAAVVVPIDIVDVADQANVRALTEAIEEMEANAAEEREASEESMPAPSPSPTPAPQSQSPNEFSVDAAANLIDRAREESRRRQEGEQSDQTRRGAGLGTDELASLEARIAAISSREFNRCWRSVADMPDPERLVVVLSVRFNRDGSLSGRPRVVTPTNYTFDPLMNEAVNRAVRAVLTCDPIEQLPSDPIVGEHFDLWRDQEVTFGVRRQ